MYNSTVTLKKNGGKWKKMEISKLLVFFILSLDTTSAWDKFCRDSCCLASLFPIVRSFFSSWDFVFSAIQLQASRTSPWSTSRLQKQHFFIVFVPLFSLALMISYRFACPLSLQFSYFVENLRASSIAFLCPWIHIYNCFTAKDLSLGFYFVSCLTVLRWKRKLMCWWQKWWWALWFIVICFPGCHQMHEK